MHINAATELFNGRQTSAKDSKKEREGCPAQENGFQFGRVVGDADWGFPGGELSAPGLPVPEVAKDRCANLSGRMAVGAWPWLHIGWCRQHNFGRAESTGISQNMEHGGR